MATPRTIVNKLLEDGEEDEARDMLMSGKPATLYYVCIYTRQNYFLSSFSVRARDSKEAEMEAARRMREVAPIRGIDLSVLQGLNFETCVKTWDTDQEL